MKRELNFVLPLIIIFFSAFFLLCSVTPSPIYAMDVTLSWEANTEADLAGYRIYYKTANPDAPYNGTGAAEGNSPVDFPIELIDTNVPIFTFTNLSDTQVYYFAVTAYDTSNLESEYSNEVSTCIIGVTSINSGTSSGSYRVGDDIDITLNFSEALTLSWGNLIVTLNTGRTIEIEPFVAQTSVSANYTIQVDDNTSDLSINSLTLSDGATLRNADGIDCPLSLPEGNNLADNTDIVVDNTNVVFFEIQKTIPYNGAGVDDNTRIPINTSFCVLFEHSDGIDITDANSISFTINDSVNTIYERDLSDTNVVRVVKLNLEESDTQVTKLWVVYDRSKELELGLFLYDQNVNIKIDAKDIGQNWMEQASYDFEIESEDEHDNAQANLPEFEPVVGDDPALTGPYDEGIQVISGDLYGAKIIYNSAEAVTPAFGPINELPSLNITDEETTGISMALQPPTVFSTPVKIFIPCPGQTDVSELGVYLYNGANYVMACNADGQVQPGGEAWMVPGSRVDHNEDDPATIEIKVYYFFGGVLAQEVLPRNLLPASQIDNNADNSGGAGGGCFINSL